MITRAYQNAKGERQEVTLSAAEWEELTEDALKEILGLGAPAPKAPSAPASAPATKAPVRKKK